MLRKKGDAKWDIILWLILGLLILSMSLYYIFNKYFTSEDIDYTVCKQAITLRSSLPEADLVVATVSAKDEFALKCKTNVINIDYKDTAKAEKTFAETLASCWGLTGGGQLNIFADSKRTIKNFCMTCSRIHLNSDVLEYYRNNPINFERAITHNKINPQQSYSDYLLFGDIKALPIPFIKDSNGILSVKPYSDSNVFEANYVESSTTQVYKFPKLWDVDRGDVFVVLSVPSLNDRDSLGKRTSPMSLLYLQSADLQKLNSVLKWLWWGLAGDIRTCDEYVTIPA